MRPGGFAEKFLNTWWLLDWHEIRVSGRSINLGGQAVMQWLLMEQAFFLILPKSGEGGGAMAHHAPLVSTGLLKCDDFKTTAQHLSIMWSETNLRTKNNFFDLHFFKQNSVCKKKLPTCANPALTPNTPLIHISFTYSKWNMYLKLIFLLKNDGEKLSGWANLLEQWSAQSLHRKQLL